MLIKVFLFHPFFVQNGTYLLQNKISFFTLLVHYFDAFLDVLELLYFLKSYAFTDSSIATATATVIPTIGLLPAPMRPIIST